MNTKTHVIVAERDPSLALVKVGPIDGCDEFSHARPPTLFTEAMARALAVSVMPDGRAITVEEWERSRLLRLRMGDEG